jgi:hypothetical protein
VTFCNVYEAAFFALIPRIEDNASLLLRQALAG